MEEENQTKELFDLYEKYFFLPKSRLMELVDDFCISLEDGLKNHTNPLKINKCYSNYKPFKMLDSCIDKLPTGKEKGVYYAIDMGGTNLRCVRVNLLGNGQSETKFKKTKLTEMKVFASEKVLNGSKCSKICQKEVNILDKTVSSETMFNSIASFFNEFLKECGDLNDLGSININSFPIEVAFTFSFPTMQFGIANANLLIWTKGIETGRSTNDPVEGKDIGDQLNSAFKRNGIPACCKCIVNDTVGTLLSAMYDLNVNNCNINNHFSKVNENISKEVNTLTRKSENKPLVGIVVGTGVNACYYEPDSLNFGYKGVIINTECGDFYSSKLPSTDCDLTIDWFSDNRGKQRFEKMISGTYLGEISRLLIINFLKYKTPKIFFKKDSFKTEHIAEIISQFNDSYHNFNQNHDSSCNQNLKSIENYLRETFSSDFDHNSTHIIARISQMVLMRAASLVSVLLAAFIKRINKSHNEVIIAIDGSVWTKIPTFQNYVKKSLSSIIQESGNLGSIYFYESDDGSGRGAAVLASTISHIH
ncbi:hexokinase I [Cryptosporidium ubiquitum]|uniref:Phosphotransferase n=1 Tax=Cryptosporidium ubiquitum TaxID=857276 RepID=A0A1J4MKA1_9CRYT|nr:hexokinase I [Cryptosporidium ubiquitum]OII73277.1 hexokinase I [Cryptosporidium ubiquitum]